MSSIEDKDRDDLLCILEDTTLLYPVIAAVEELRRANNIFPGFASPHEGYAILAEEVDELWELVKTNPRNLPVTLSPNESPFNPSQETQFKQRSRLRKRMGEEATQVAAMALKFLQMLTIQERQDAMANTYVHPGAQRVCPSRLHGEATPSEEEGPDPIEDASTDSE